MDKVGSLVGNLRRAVDLSLIKNQNPEEPLFSTLPPSSFGKNTFGKKQFVIN